MTVEEDVETDLFLYEYFRLNVVNVSGRQLALHAHGRVLWNRLATDRWDGRFYQGYLDWKPTKLINFRAGRQFLPNDVGFWQMDGVRINLNLLKWLSPSIYGGVTEPPWSLARDRGGVLGVDVERRILTAFQTKVSFLTLFDEEAIDRAILGFRLDAPSTSIFDLHRDARKRFHLAARGSVDLLTQEVISGNVSIALRPLATTQISMGYRHETPLFPAESIFSVFDIEPIKELTIGLDTNLISWVGVHGRYAHQFFDLAEVDRYISGFSIRNQRETLLRFHVEHLNDGARKYWRTYASLNKLVTPRWQIGLVNYYNNYRFSAVTQSETAYSFQFNTDYRFHNNIRLLVRIEDNVNPDFQYNIRAYSSLRLDLDFR